MKLVRRADEVEQALLIANRLRGGTTEDLMVRLWRNLSYLHANEAARLAKEAEELQEDRRTGRDARRTGARRRGLDRRLQRYEADIEKASEAYEALRVKISDAGFIIDDSDRDIFDAD